MVSGAWSLNLGSRWMEAGRAGAAVLGIDDPSFNDPQSSYPNGERPLELIDNIKFSPSKYLNFGRENSGVIVTPSVPSRIPG